jgi:carboxypeptidase C (cathepsin A)
VVGIVDNPNSILDTTDLVFIDLSALASAARPKGEKPEQFFGVG